MNSILKKYINSLVGLLLFLVISPSSEIFAAIQVSVEAPIVDGLRTPMKFAVDGNGDLYVADPRAGGIVIINQYGKLVRVLNTSSNITSVALLGVGNPFNAKFVAAFGDRVAVLDADGVEVAQIGAGAGQFVKTAGIAVDQNGKIYVVDAGAYQAKVFTADGHYDFSFGSYGTLGGQFILPNGITIFSESAGPRIAVTDIMRGKVDVFNFSGAYQRTIGTPGTGPVTGSALYYPSGIAFEYKNGSLFRTYVLDMYLGQVKVITAGTSTIEYVGSYGYESGKLITPSDIQFDSVNKRLLIANGLSNVVSYGIDGGKNPVNSIPPALTINNSGLTVETPSIVLTGTVDANCTLSASVSTSARAGAASFSSATSWRIPVDGLVQGRNVISVTATNSYGTSVTQSVTVQYAPPTAALSINSFPSLTSQSTIVLSGASEAGSSVYVTNSDSHVTGQADINSSGSWVYSVKLLEGINNIEVAASRFGATAAFKSITIILDTTAPALYVSAMPDGSSTASPVQNISGTVIDPNLANVTVNGAQVPFANGSFSYPLTLNKGPNVIIVTASDALGNTRTDSRTIIFNPALPVISVVSPADGAYTNNADIIVSGVVDKAASVTVNGISANVAGALEWNATVRLAAGMNTIEIAGTDQYGSVAKQKRTIFYDKVAPDVAITYPSQDVAVKSPGMTIKGSVGDDTGIASIKATVNGVDKQVVYSNGEFSLFADFIVEGANVIAVTVTDLAGNSSTAVRTVVYDITPPTLAVDQVTTVNPTLFSGFVETGASIVVKDAAGISGKVTVSGEKWTADFAGLPYDPATLIAQAVDAAGNVSINRIAIPSGENVSLPAPEIVYGDVDGDGVVTLADAMTALRLVVANEQPTPQQLVHGDIGPLLNGKVNPKGRLDVVDVVLILRKALGLQSW